MTDARCFRAAQLLTAFRIVAYLDWYVFRDGTGRGGAKPLSAGKSYSTSKLCTNETWLVSMPPSIACR